MPRIYSDIPREQLDAFLDSPEFQPWLERAQRNYDLATLKMERDLDRLIAEDIRQIVEQKP